MLTSVSSWQGASLFGCLSLWRDWAAWEREQDASEGYGAAAAAEHWRFKHQLEAFKLWRYRQSMDWKSSLNDAEQLWRSKALDVIFVRWRDYTYLYYELMELMAQASFRFYHKSLSDVFQHWRSYERRGKLVMPRSPYIGMPTPGVPSLANIPSDPLDQSFEAQYRGSQ
eukprot:TRINITY_DN18487_c0_g2_i3.p1 TRINITY_DN18487_c0_g2~~TRINITY_DN18487_c0_g2_i3.p1  ORF type:complete len:169 (-),score=21.93 TRINITY_DN18487_c0_g2_i3:131-637(-)